MEHPGISLDGNQGKRWPMRLWVFGAVLLSCLVFAPLVWHVNNTFHTFRIISQSHQESEILRDRLSHLNQNIVVGTRDLVACGDGDPGPVRQKQVLELTSSLAEVKLGAATCKVAQYLANADSSQATMRHLEAIALELGGSGAMGPAQSILQGQEYWQALSTFTTSLDSLTAICSTTRNLALAKERSREVATLAGAAILLALSVGTWISLLRRIENRERSLRLEVIERRRTGAKLAATVGRCEKLFNEAYDSILLVNPDNGRIIDVNRRGAARLGYTHAELCGKLLTDLDVGLAAELEAAGGLASRLGACDGRIEERQHRCRDGTLLTVEASNHLIKDGETTILQCVARDITERNQLERQLSQAQKMECVGRIASGIAHDFSNLLIAIKGYTSVASHLLNRDHPATRPLNQIGLASSQAIEVAKSLLTFASGNKQPGDLVELGQVMANVAQLLRPSLPPGITLEVAPAPPEELWVKGDRSLLQQALLNLGLNAREAMPHGGIICLALRRDGNRAVVQFTDDGVGIPQELLEKIWEPFFTTRTDGKGTGLGLFNVKSALDSCHGTFDVRPRPEGGTIFSLLIPLEEAGRLPVSEPHLVDDRLMGRNILLAEPHGFAREVMTEALRFKGFTVFPVANGPELVEVLNRARSSHPEETIDLAILDPDLPGARDLKCLKEIRDLKESLPVILIGCRQDLAQDDGLDKHTVILNKPFEMKELCRLASDVIVAFSLREGDQNGSAKNSVGR